MKEVWKDVPNFEGYYQVSSFGRVKCLDRIVKYKDGRVCYFKSKLMKQGTNKKGYKKVYFSKDCIQSVHSVHKLVMSAFVGLRPHPKMQINHIDCDKTNNCLSNLEYCTQSQNQIHAFANGLIERKGEKNSISKFMNSDIYQICLDYKNGKSSQQIAVEKNVSKSSICRILSKTTYKTAPRP